MVGVAMPLSYSLALLLAERDRWFLWCPAGLAVGIAAYMLAPVEPSLWWMTAWPALALALWLARRQAALCVLLMAMAMPLLGFGAAMIQTRLVAAPMLDSPYGPTSLSGRLARSEIMPDGSRLILEDVTIGRLPPWRTPATIRIKSRVPYAELPPPGTRVESYGEAAPFSEPLAPGAFDFRRMAYFRGFGATGWTYGALKTIESPKTDPSVGESVTLAFERARRRLTLLVLNRLSGDEAAMTAALLNGQQSGIGRPVMEAMRASGLAHLLSISGVHVSIVGLLVYGTLRALLALIPWIALRFSIKKWAACAATLATLAYVMLVGPETPTLRSALMTALVMLAIIVDRRATSMRIVTLTAMAVMLAAPDSVMGPSFQMSFAAVLAMVAAFEKPIDAALLERKPRTLPQALAFIRKHVVSIVTTSLVATAATAPFTLYHFQSFSFYGVLSNMLAIPLTSFWIMPCLLLIYILAPFGLAGPVIDAAGLGVRGIIALAEHVAAWPLATLYAPAMPHMAFVVMILGGFWLCLWRRRWRWLGLLPILGGMLYPLYVQPPALLATPDGMSWAVRLSDGRYATGGVKAPGSFITEQWQRHLGMPVIAQADKAEEPLPDLDCDTLGCVWTPRPDLRVALPRRADALVEDCRRATLIVTPFDGVCDAALIVTRKDFDAHGSLALFLPQTQDAPTLAQSRPAHALRPWSPGWRGFDATQSP